MELRMHSRGLKTTATSLWTTLRLSLSIRMAALALQKSAVSVDWLEWSLDALSGDSSDCRGPVGIAVGLIGGGIIGAVGRKEHSFDKEFANGIRNALTPGKAAVIAEVTEVSEPPVDNRMAELGGIVFRWTIDRIKIGDSKRRSADLDELGVKIDDAIASRKAEVQARQHERERWIHLLEQEAAEGRRKRREPHTAELPTAAAAKPAAQYGA
jgi:hypothetical protein